MKIKPYSQQVISNRVLKALAEGTKTSDVQDLYLMMRMSNDLGEEWTFVSEAPSVKSIRMQLLENGTIDASQIGKLAFTAAGNPVGVLSVGIAPNCRLCLENIQGTLQVRVNDKNMTTMSLRHQQASDVVSWILRQKRNYDQYLDDWEKVLRQVSKRAKGNHMSMLAIKAIFSTAMKEHPDLKYQFIEQKRRMRIKVYLPGSLLGVYVDAWWGSYKERLPQQINDLRVLIEAHKSTQLKNFFTINIQ